MNKGDLCCHEIHGIKVDLVRKQGINLFRLIMPLREGERETDYKELQKAGQKLTKGRNRASHLIQVSVLWSSNYSKEICSEST